MTTQLPSSTRGASSSVALSLTGEKRKKKKTHTHWRQQTFDIFPVQLRRVIYLSNCPYDAPSLPPMYTVTKTEVIFITSTVIDVTLMVFLPDKGSIASLRLFLSK